MRRFLWILWGALSVVPGLSLALWPLWCNWSGLAFGVQWLWVTPSASVVLFLIAFLGTAIYSFSLKNLEGDPVRSAFLRRLVWTLWSVEGLVAAGNFLVFFAFWIGASMGLHRLLTIYPARPLAIAAARKKFLISRLGDLFLAVSGVLMLTSGTWNFPELKDGTLVTQLAAVFAVFGALTKSAQVPFHSWLPNTLEAPTPVSALMHAGIINAGGYLVLRLGGLVGASESALGLLIAFGTVTAVWGCLTMMTQADIKRQLAWSTVAQMGFMMVELGFGAFTLALLHLVGHGLYKARAFLRSGELRKIGSVEAKPSLVFALVGSAVLAAVCMSAALLLGGFHFWLTSLSFAVLLPLAAGGKTFQTGLGYGILAGLFALASVEASAFLQPWLGLKDHLPESLGRSSLAATSLLVLLALSVFTILRERMARWAWVQKIYFASLHGFGFGHWADRAVQKVWPIKGSLK